MRWKYALTKSENSELATARKATKPIFAAGIEKGPPSMVLSNGSFFRPRLDINVWRISQNTTEPMITAKSMMSVAVMLVHIAFSVFTRLFRLWNEIFNCARDTIRICPAMNDREFWAPITMFGRVIFGLPFQ